MAWKGGLGISPSPWSIHTPLPYNQVIGQSTGVMIGTSPQISGVSHKTRGYPLQRCMKVYP